MEINIDNILYMLRRRGTGKTQLMIDGVAHYDYIFYVVTTHMHMARHISDRAKNPNARYISVYDTEKLLGSMRPIVLDHTAWEAVLMQQELKIQNLNNEINDLQLEILGLKLELGK